jgi:hypothetical protein
LLMGWVLLVFDNNFWKIGEKKNKK